MPRDLLQIKAIAAHIRHMTMQKRSNIYQIRKRVPKRYVSVEPRDVVWISLHTDSEVIAKIKAPKVWAGMIEAWEARLAGDTTDAEAQYAAARDLAAARGYRFLSAERVSRLPKTEFAARVDEVMAASKGDKPDMVLARAVLGGTSAPPITVSRALELYWEVKGKADITGKSPDQLRRWKNPRIKAFSNFIAVNGNIPISEIGADEMLAFRDWWEAKIEAEGLSANSANKDFVNLSSALRLVIMRKRLNLDLPLSGYSFREGEAKVRPPFSVGWIKDKLLAPGALNGLNPEARAIMLGMVNTGYRPSEGAGLTRDQIRLDVNVPHISIEALGRELKSRNAKRIIPLVGVSLEAFRAYPDGFPRYRAGSATLSATVNKYLRENKLLETPGHSLYGLRHSFEDRLLSAEVDERIRRDLFGHALGREKYGKGADLDHLRRVVELVAI
jgi:integrase